MTRLEQPFYARKAQTLAPALLGKIVVRRLESAHSENGYVYLSGIIVETEAYGDVAERDLACHGDRANGGQPTPRTQIMFGPAGFAYVYFTYGMHWMFNVVTGETGRAGAVLLRALQPVMGVEEMRLRRNGRILTELTNGPAKLAQALAIDQSLNGANLCAADGVIWIEDAPPIPTEHIAVGPRIGLGKTPEPWLSMPWRYWIKDNSFVSK
ncbi:MAG: DNA-3-methyladenine glycosylase [Anaerolineales bacterium]|nr:DNA-3-methyladenine glycosylase [Anaerolineales bacterium]MCB8968293.1 DNA-3-methyladenine glycosylase [Ardenticatenaceae bacterium]